jgi:hypothetical protein
MANLGTLLIFTVVPATLNWIYTRSAAGKAVTEHGSVVFPESKVVPVTRWATLVVFPVGAFLSWIYLRSVLATLIFAGFAILAVVSQRGGPIVINRDGVSGASIWGRRATISWCDVVSLEFNTGNSNTTVVGKSGAKVCHSGFHLDRARFEAEVKRRTGLPVKVIRPGFWKPRVSYR